LKLTIDSVIRLQDVPGDVLKQIKAELTLDNPTYKRKRAMGVPVWGEPRIIKLWSERDIDGKKEYVLPRGYWWKLVELIPGIDKFATDNTVRLYPIGFQSKIQLRDYQKDMVVAMLDIPQGIGVAPCGAGKTEAALELIAQTEQPALWITHTKDLLKQSMDRAISKLQLKGNQIGIIMAEQFSIGTHITFATVQTLAKRDLTGILDKFGCIVVDECHHCFKDYAKSRMFEDVISQFPAYYRYGLTASEHRSDGLIETMYHIIGPKIYEVTQEQLNSQGNVMVPKVYFIETGFQYDQPVDEDGEKEMMNVQQLVRAMRLSDRRNRLILDCLNHQKHSDFVLVLDDSLAHLQELRDTIDCLDELPAAFISGETPKLKRDKIMEDFRAGRYTYLFATYQLAKEGLDIPRLNTLILLTPKKDRAIVQQSVGRIMRPLEGKKQPVVYDFYDSKIKQCVFWARERAKVYGALGCQVEGGPKVRKK